MLVNLTQKQLEKVIEALEEKPEQINDKFSVLNYLKMVKQNELEQQLNLDEIPF